jgi:hypothetical protein
VLAEAQTVASRFAGTSVSVIGLAHDIAYNFQVIATNSGGTATSATAILTTAMGAPMAVIGLSASAGAPAASVAQPRLGDRDHLRFLARHHAWRSARIFGDSG